MDRIIQQAIIQVLNPICEPHFSETNYGFRPNRSCERAIIKLLEYLNDVYEWMGDIDLEKFFDTVPQDRLMSLVHNIIQDGDVRFNELHRQIEGISQATLTKQLRQLEEDGLITHKVYPQVPPKVEYNLSDLGKEFTSVLDQINIFGQKYIEFVKEKEN